MVQDFFTTPQLRPFLTSKDKTTWVLPVGLAGEMGTPRGYDAYKRVADLVKHNVADGPLKVHVTGPAATVADLTVAGEQDRLPIEIAIAVMVLLVLLVVYRNPITMLLPLVTIGAAFVTAQAAVAGVSDLFGIGVSNQSMVFLSAMIAGAGTDYAVFLISRYHDYLRQGADVNDAVKQALISIGKVITASAATVGVTFIGLSFAKMGVFSTIGVACAIAVGVAYLAAMTLLPAILVLAGARGLVKPRRELTARFWRRSGVRIVRRPKAHLIGSLLVLAILAGCAGLVNYNYDDRKALGPDAPSSMGYAALERHFPISQAVPEYILVESPRDLRTPQALADLEQMASRVSQLPDISLISGLTRPTGEVPPEFRATYQAGVVGDRMAQGSQVISDNKKDLNRLQNGAGTLASSLNDVRAQINKVAPSMQRMIDALNAVRGQFGGDKLVKQVETAAQLVQSVNALGNSIGVNFSSVREMFAWIGPVLAALNGNAICDASPSCADTRIQFQKLMDARDDGRLDQINSLASQLKGVGDNKSLNATVNQLNATLSQFSSAVRSMGLDSPGGLQAGLTQVRQGANRLADGSQQVAGGVDELVEQVKIHGRRARRGGRVPVGDAQRRSGSVDGRLQPAFPDPAARRVQEGREHLHLARRAYGALSGVDQPQPVQHPGDGSGERDHRRRPQRPAEHPTRRRQNHRGWLPRRAARHPRLLPTRHPVHHRDDAHRRAADPDAAAAGDRRADLPDCVGDHLVLRRTRYHRPDVPIPARPTVALECSAAGVRGVGRGRRRLQHAPGIANARRISAQHSLRHHPHPVVHRRGDHGGRFDLRRIDERPAVLQHQHRCPGRIPHRHRRSAGHLPGQDRHGARHGDLGGTGQLVAVQAEFAAPRRSLARQRPERRSNVTGEIGGG